ncbi:Txe/YoeB family addiction module toxin [Pedobacter petrophilus]|uniref:Putative mRNA interferase YoeB n=1 Tax=Pedobacter petrophilus TaxID=1908241 RepID=A0A7K0FWA7_9SPHI|nr:Txe/YoeB family addiction module toxin [Pedobacter petrophilus]MRX75269.1 Txe/YoeB family addiction module toxin [Pedobacter petrophilus]
MQIELYEQAITDFKFWQQNRSKKNRNTIADMILHPFTGLGKPEALKHKLSGKWSRRINEEHRIVYEVINNYIFVYSLKGHYK